MRPVRSALPAAGLLPLLALAPPLLAQAPDPIGRATLPLPAELRDDATVLVPEDGEWRVVREGDGAFVCLADEPGDDRFHVACYHRDLEAYMARGRELAAQGVTGRESLARRWEEIEAGSLAMPEGPAPLVSLNAEEEGATDPAGARRLTVLYVPYATAEELGLPTEPGRGTPWLMFPGRPTAHIMIHR